MLVSDCGGFGGDWVVLNADGEIADHASSVNAGRTHCSLETWAEYQGPSHVVSKKIPEYLRLHMEEPAESKTACAPASEFTDLCAAFQDATGWALQLEFPSHEAEEPATEPAGMCSFRLSSEKQAEDKLPRPKAQRLAAALAQVLGELDLTRDAVWRREADLAAGVPVTSQNSEEAHLAKRLECVLKGGAQAVGCQAAGIYLLDDATTELKLRATWGLPRHRLLAPARPLRGAVADLEALVGHAVVLEDASLLPAWKVPEGYASAVCVPISSPSEPLGTLWMYCTRARNFTAEQTNLIEIIAGRVASELQREMLLRECTQTKQSDRQLSQAVRWQNDRLPSVTPLLDDWDVAGWVGETESLRGGFYDWFVPPGGELSVALARAQGTEFESALTAAALHGALRCQSERSHTASELGATLNDAMWNSSAGGQTASFFYAMIRPETGHVECLPLGAVTGLILGEDGLVRVPRVEITLGAQPCDGFPVFRHELRRGEFLVLLAGVESDMKGSKAPSRDTSALVEQLVAGRCKNVESLLSLLRDWAAVYEQHGDEHHPPGDSPMALVVHRKNR